ncbi:hypothetical protein A0H77_19490 [Vibrio alginolyticus]|uniref:hypothetical protein n=1 Tax=Vibrio alginolyticus TaxID=663 RepID=UPI00079B994A|nr:hypothetical protein [Vibrio alginolyticus]KXZ35082.1 hypothetical protein A0H77_19490 [Vibrio alginolyticus]
MMIKSKELQKLISANANDMAIHNAIVEGLESIFDDEDLSDGLKLMWYDFREVLNFKDDIQEYHYSIFVNNLKTLVKLYEDYWGNQAKSTIKVLQHSIARFEIYKDCLTVGLSIRDYEILLDSIIEVAND